VGTSSAYSAPSTGNWPRAKTLMTRFARGTSGLGVLPRLLRSYVSAKGGSASAATSASAGRAAAGRLGRFFTTLGTAGLDSALREFRLDHLVGRPPEECLAGIVDALCGPGGTVDEDVARAAMIEVLAQLADQCATADELEMLLAQQATADGLVDILQDFVFEYIFERLLLELGGRDAAATRDQAAIVNAERELRDYLRARIETVDFSQQRLSGLDWNSPEASAAIERLFRDAYAVAEELL